MDVQALSEKAVVVDVVFHLPTMTRRGDLGSVETDADKRLLGLTKRIVESEHYLRLQQIARECRQWFQRHEIPFLSKSVDGKQRATLKPLKQGAYLIAKPLIGEATNRIQQAQAAYAATLEEFVAEYPAKVAEAKARLKSQATGDWPNVDWIRDGTWVEWRLVSFGPPSENLLAQHVDAETRAKLDEAWAATGSEITAALRESFQGLVSGLAKALQVEPDGTKHVFRSATVEKVVEFLDLFESRNLLGDDALAQLVASAKGVLNGKKPEDLRTSDVYRGQVKAEMERVSVALQGLLSDAPVRAIEFED